MPFCSQCGTPVEATQPFCARCGARQPLDPAAAHPVAHDPLTGVSPRTASVVCYIPVVGWIAAIVVLASHRYRQMPAVRFHAFQGLYLFVAYLMNDQMAKWAFLPIAHFHLHELLNLVLLAMSIFMMVKASHDEAYSLPLFGELAQRSVSEN
jgi:uncharacterized membrane protein